MGFQNVISQQTDSIHDTANVDFYFGLLVTLMALFGLAAAGGRGVEQLTAFAHLGVEKGLDQGDRLRVIEFEATGFAAFRQQSGGKQHELVFFTRGQFHGRSGMSADGAS